jgi:T4 RnlA family RNA ligase
MELFKSQGELYNHLMTLVETSEAFFYADQEMRGHWFRIFNYRLASYTEFMLPGAMECRGIMFEITEEGQAAKLLRLASRPMEKFFNYRENPLTMDVDLSTVTDVWDKADGSLISTYTIDGHVFVKSKGSLHSEQAVAAYSLIHGTNNVWGHERIQGMLDELAALESDGYTVNMEYVGPDNRIVIGYAWPDLIVLNARHRQTGEYLDYDQIQHRFPFRNAVRYSFADAEAMRRFFVELPDETGIEGVVVRTETGLHMKMKTEAYLTAHRAKDSINSPRRLFECALEDGTDDLRSLFYDDPLALKRIEEMEQLVEREYNHLVDTVERFHARNKHLDRKSYAILGQQELDRRQFGLAMRKFSGQEADYKECMRKNYKDFGIKDDPEPTGEE